MWIKNNDKERIKSYIKNDIESNITNITSIINHLHDLIYMINRAVAESPSGFDRIIINDCKKIIIDLSSALQILYTCRRYADQIDTKEWVEDE